jgi:hypothetical protein
MIVRVPLNKRGHLGCAKSRKLQRAVTKLFNQEPARKQPQVSNRVRRQIAFFHEEAFIPPRSNSRWDEGVRG